jgi:hypothetical protein
MPLQIPTLDDRRYPELLDEALRRIPVHNPEWTNLTPVTLASADRALRLPY